MTISVDWGRFLMDIVMFFPAMLIHELGHALVGFVQGAKSATIHFGHWDDRRILVLPLGRISVEFHVGRRFLTVPSVWMSGYTSEGPRSVIWLFAFGPVASLISYVTVQAFAHRPLWVYWMEASWVDFFLYWAAIGVVIPLVPMRYPSGLSSDGLHILRAVQLLARRDRSAGRQG